MFDARLETLHDGHVRKYAMTRDAVPLRYAEVIGLWQHDQAFRACFLSILSEVPFLAYRWETPAVTTATAGRAFEFVLLDSPSLARPPDRHSFAGHFAPASSEAGIVVFDNLGGDATLVVPSPRGPAGAYGHLAAFTRRAPAFQNHALWEAVGRAMEQRVSERPVWLSTAGGGVSWLHVRLDDRPKYYGFRPYRAAP